MRVGDLRVPSTKVIGSGVRCAEGSWRAAVGIAMWPSATLIPTPSFALAGSNRVALRGRASRTAVSSGNAGMSGRVGVQRGALVVSMRKGAVRLPHVAYGKAHGKNDRPQLTCRDVQTDKVDANLLGFDSRERKEVDALCNAVEPQGYNRKGNGSTNNHERDVFCRTPVSKNAFNRGIGGLLTVLPTKVRLNTFSCNNSAGRAAPKPLRHLRYT